MNKEVNKLLIGLEIHITLKSKKKMFNWVDSYQENSLPNSQISPWELGYLGTLPIINPECVELALRLSLACQMKINSVVLFDRKIYHYHDLPKGYQITQYNQPLSSKGYFPLISPGGIKNVPLKVLQLEEDTAKSFYAKKGIELDFNRAGNPLIELVTDPVFSDSEEAVLFIKQLQNLLKYLEISTAKMEKGQLRIDLNFSLKLAKNYQTPRYEVKNLNSLNNLTKVLQHEIDRHQQLRQQKLSPPPSQTLGFNEQKQIAVALREKADYFYLPETNIPPIKITKREIQKIAKSLPVLPWIKWSELVKKKIDPVRANLIIEKPFLLHTLNFLEKKNKLFAKEIDNWITFSSNYLLPYFPGESFFTFKKRWGSYWQLFCLWKDKKMETKEIKDIAEQLVNGKKTLSKLVKKYQKEEKFDSLFIFSGLEKMWSDDLAKSYLIKPQKVQNFLLGQMKKQNLNLDIKKLNEIVNSFIKSKL